VYSQFELIKLKLKKVNWNFVLFLGAYEINVCCGPFSKIAPPPPPRVTQAYPIAAQKTPWLAHLHPWRRGNVVCDTSVYRILKLVL
jgi:hypothetical protein